LDYENGYTTPSKPEDEVVEDFRQFRDLITAGVAFMKHQSTKKAIRFNRAFAALSRAGLASISGHKKFSAVSLVLDHDAHIPRAALFILDRFARSPVGDLAFRDLLDVSRTYLSYEGDNDLWTPALGEFRLLGDAVHGILSHTREIQCGYVNLDWSSIDVINTDDVPIAVIRATLSWGLQDSPESFLASLEQAKAAESLTYIPPPYFPRFRDLAPEIRQLIIHQYLLGERQDGRLSKQCPHDKFGSRCCVWEDPDVLIACDSQNSKTFPAPETGLAPDGWLPALAFTHNRAVLDEVVEIMPRKTARFDLKYDQYVPHFKIATWLRNFIAALPYDDGLRAIKYLCFPHMHYYNSVSPFALTNPSIELMAACQSLRKVDMTFFHAMLRVADPALGYTIRPRTAVELVNFFQMWLIFQCTELGEVHFDGIYAAPGRGGSPADLVALDNLAKWLKKGFLIRRGQEVKVEVVRRWGKWKGRQVGTLVTVNEEDMADVAEGHKYLKRQIPSPADVGARCAYPVGMRGWSESQRG